MAFERRQRPVSPDGSTRFGPGKVSLAPVLVLALGTVPLAGTDRRLVWLLLVPLACAVWVFRARVVVSPRGLELCDGLRLRRLPWDRVEGFDVPPRGRAAVLTTGGRRALVGLPREQVRYFLEACRTASVAQHVHPPDR